MENVWRVLNKTKLHLLFKKLGRKNYCTVKSRLVLIQITCVFIYVCICIHMHIFKSVLVF